MEERDRIHLCIMTSGGVKYEEKAHYVGLPLENGDAAVLTNHAPLIAAVKNGPVKCKFGDVVEYVCIGRGVVEVFENNVTLLVRTAEAARDIDLARAEASERRARERIRGGDQNTDQIRAGESLSRALARVRTCRLHLELGQVRK